MPGDRGGQASDSGMLHPDSRGQSYRNVAGHKPAAVRQTSCMHPPNQISSVFSPGNLQLLNRIVKLVKDFWPALYFTDTEGPILNLYYF
jgi:hypothetical protein